MENNGKSDGIFLDWGAACRNALPWADDLLLHTEAGNHSVHSAEHSPCARLQAWPLRQASIRGKGLKKEDIHI